MKKLIQRARRWKHICCAGLLLVVFSSPAKGDALAGLERLEHLPPENPLADQWVRVITQDRRGFLWLGTINGIHRFDGYSVKSFRHDPEDPRSLPNNFINDIYEDSDGVLWIGTMDGLARLDEKQQDEHEAGQFVTASTSGLITTFRHAQEIGNPQDGRVSRIVEDHLGALWLATHNGAYRFDRDAKTFTRFALEPSGLQETQFLTVFRGQAGDLWFGAGGPALLRFDHQRGVLERHVFEDPGNISVGVWTIVEGEDGVFWCGTEAGDLYRFDPRTGVASRIDLGEDSRGYITTLLLRPDGRLWLGTDKQGVIVFDPETGLRQTYRPMRDLPGSISGPQVSAIFQDRSGVIWLGTDAGLDKYVPSKESFALYRHRVGDVAGLSSSRINNLAGESTGDLWISTEEGLDRIDRTGKVIRSYQHDPGNPDSFVRGNTNVLMSDSQGDLWIAGDRELVRFDSENETFVRFARSDELIETVYSMAESDPGILWIGGHGINRLEVASRQLQFFPEPDRILSMIPDGDGGLWLATYGQGLQRFDPSSGVTAVYRQDSKDPQSLSSDFLVSLLRDRSGTLWIGTLGGGLNRFDIQNERFTSYRESDGLSNDNVVSLVEDAHGILWLGTDRGLNRFDPVNESWRSYTTEDGLQGLAFSLGSAWRSPTGELFFGGLSGLSSFYPDQIQDNPNPPPVAITDFLLLNRSTPFEARRSEDRSPTDGGIPHLVLDHRDDILAFRFAALDFAKPAENSYAYKMAGFNDQWVEVDARNRLAQYTNLDSGEYVFQVKAANPDGVWTSEATSVRITVLPPPWKTWWAYSLYAMALAAIVLSYVRSQQRELRRQREVAEHERAVSRQLREVDRLKDDFLANTSHELRTPLYGMTGLAESLIDGVSGELPESARMNLKMIVNSGRRLSHLVNDILDFSKLRHRNLEIVRGSVDLRPLVDVVLTLSKPLLGSKDLRLINAVPAQLPAAEADEDRLQQILHNLIGNAIKFTEKGSVEISASVHSKMLEVRVKDSGIGIPAADQTRIFDVFEQADPSIDRRFGGTGLGLAVTRQLVEVHGGQIRVESTSGQGSSFIFSLPIASGEYSGIVDRPDTDIATAPAPIEPLSVDSEAEVLDSSTTLREEPSGGGARVLVVDDEPINLQVVRNYLAAEGYELTLASSGEAALRLLDERTFDLVLLDVMMPRVSGYEVCRSLRENHAISDLPVIFLTARTQDTDVVAGMNLGANDYLSKPISKDRLLARVRPHLDLLRVHRNLEDLVEEKMSEVKVLRGLLPICSGCKKIRDESGAWSEIESYIDARSEAQFSHGMCPSCVERFYKKHPELRPAVSSQT